MSWSSDDDGESEKAQEKEEEGEDIESGEIPLSWSSAKEQKIQQAREQYPCAYCHQKGHHINDCPRVTCMVCNELGHTAGACKYKPPWCWKCKSPGHNFRECNIEECEFCEFIQQRIEQGFTYLGERSTIRPNLQPHEVKYCYLKASWQCTLCWEYGHHEEQCL